MSSYAWLSDATRTPFASNRCTILVIGRSPKFQRCRTSSAAWSAASLSRVGTSGTGRRNCSSMVSKNSSVSDALARTASRLVALALLSLRKLAAPVAIGSIDPRSRKGTGTDSASASLLSMSSVGGLWPFS